jgi:hypothetical protein
MRNFDIGITGLAGSGKDTAADFICSQYGYTRVSFAAKLKLICLTLGWDGQKNARGRKLLQDVGMTFREYNPDTWITEVDNNLDSSKHYVFTDVRFQNEAEYIKNKRNGIIIRIIRSSLPLEETHSHISECGQSAIAANYVVLNSGSIELLNKQLKEIIESHASNIR